jgi:predicted alpha/beta-hydrolase family hydrolase
MPIAVASGTVTALRYPAAAPGLTLVLGHGAGAPQTSDFMVTFARAFARRGLTTVTFNFPYMEARRRMPDRAPVLEAAFRAVIDAVRARPDWGRDRLVIGGKSMGGRMASHVAAAGLDRLGGCVFLGYPLHPPGRPEQLRAAHLARVREPMLFAAGRPRQLRHARGAGPDPGSARPRGPPARRRGRGPLVPGAPARTGATGGGLRPRAGGGRGLGARARTGRAAQVTSISTPPTSFASPL